MKKKVIAIVLAVATMSAMLVGCGKESMEYTIGISQFAEHGSLDNCKEGFLEGLKEAGIEEGKNLEVLLITHKQILVWQVPSQTISNPKKWI